MSYAYAQYQQLVARVAAFGQSITQRYPTQLTCHAGCDGCCYQQLTVLPVEAHHLAQAIAALSLEVRTHLAARLQPQDDPWQVLDTPQPCVLLEQGHCRLYDHRPLMCRIHGFPISSAMIERPDGLQRDCCPLNFPDLPLHDIAAQAVYNLDLVNQTLVAINHLFVQEQGLPDTRVSIRQAVLEALASGTALELPPPGA
jgi:Fe-S-cluster containining protein